MHPVMAKPMPSDQNGFTLIEVLVAVLVLTIGLLGLAGLQVTALRNNHNAYLRSQVSQLAYDLSDRIRANPIGLRTGSYDNPTAAQTAACLTTTGCSTAELARHDVYEWNADLANRLPGGSGVVCLDTSPNDGTPASPACSGGGTVYAIKIWWNDDYDLASGAVVATRHVISFQP